MKNNPPDIYYECKDTKCVISECNKEDKNCFKNDTSCNNLCDKNIKPDSINSNSGLIIGSLITIGFIIIIIFIILKVKAKRG
jgi:hypothetical protein